MEESACTGRLKISLINFAIFSNYNPCVVCFERGMDKKTVWNATRRNWCKIFIYSCFLKNLLSLCLPSSNLKRIKIAYFNLTNVAFLKNPDGYMNQRWPIINFFKMFWSIINNLKSLNSQEFQKYFRTSFNHVFLVWLLNVRKISSIFLKNKWFERKIIYFDILCNRYRGRTFL